LLESVHHGYGDFMKKSLSTLISLRRTVRIGIPIYKAAAREKYPPIEPSRNGFAGIPPSDGVTAHHEVTVECIGEPSPQTGYLIGIQELDSAVRMHLAPLLGSFFCSEKVTEPVDIVIQMGQLLERHLPPGVRLASLQWSPGPFVKLLWSTAMREQAIVTEQFEFSAAHRLHCPELSDEENRRTFGKCNHPSGHGHNYRLAVAVRVRVGTGAPTLSTGTLEGIVGRSVLDRFDHRHLNVDCPEFATLNPSVENIARVCHSLLENEISAAGAELDHVTVWETEKTSATYPAVGLLSAAL
jgi:6-pyruvoyltetrahydropterin/6-carboxytetrahydropterin synthase